MGARVGRHPHLPAGQQTETQESPRATHDSLTSLWMPSLCTKLSPGIDRVEAVVYFYNLDFNLGSWSVNKLNGLQTHHRSKKSVSHNSFFSESPLIFTSAGVILIFKYPPATSIYLHIQFIPIIILFSYKTKSLQAHCMLIVYNHLSTYIYDYDSIATTHNCDCYSVLSICIYLTDN